MSLLRCRILAVIGYNWLPALRGIKGYGAYERWGVDLSRVPIAGDTRQERSALANHTPRAGARMGDRHEFQGHSRSGRAIRSHALGTADGAPARAAVRQLHRRVRLA